MHRKCNTLITALTKKDVTPIEHLTEDWQISSRIESGELDFYPIDKLKLIAEFYGIDVTQLLDDYNLYMYKGQGQQVKALRKSMGLTQGQFASLFNLKSSNIKNWETDRNRMFKSTWKN